MVDLTDPAILSAATLVRVSSLTLLRARINLPRFQVKNHPSRHFGRVWLTILVWEDDFIVRFWVFLPENSGYDPFFKFVSETIMAMISCDLKNHPTAGKHANDDMATCNWFWQLDKWQVISQVWTWQTLKNQQKVLQDSFGGLAIFC